MAYLFLDDSKHHRSGSSLAAFASSGADSTEEMGIHFHEYSFDPGTFQVEPLGRIQDDKGLQTKLFDWKRRRSA